MGPLVVALAEDEAGAPVAGKLSVETGVADAAAQAVRVPA